MKYSVITFGCRVNQADSLAIEGSLRARALPDLIERFLDRYRATIGPDVDDRVKPLCRRGR